VSSLALNGLELKGYGMVDYIGRLRHYRKPRVHRWLLPFIVGYVT